MNGISYKSCDECNVLLIADITCCLPTDDIYVTKYFKLRRFDLAMMNNLPSMRH